jgi:serine O-acetyltransferase
VIGLGSPRRLFAKLWLVSPERLWAFSRALHRRGHPVLAFWVKQLNTILYHNSLSPAAVVGSNVMLGHYSHGVVVNSNVEIGDHVNIWHNVTLTAGRPPRREGKRVAGPAARIVIEDAVKIGTNAVVIAPRGECLRVGEGARIGAGVVVTQDVPAGATVVSPPARILLRDAQDDADAGVAHADVRSDGSNEVPYEGEHGPMPGKKGTAARSSE